MRNAIVPDMAVPCAIAATKYIARLSPVVAATMLASVQPRPLQPVVSGLLDAVPGVRTKLDLIPKNASKTAPVFQKTSPMPIPMTSGNQSLQVSRG